MNLNAVVSRPVMPIAGKVCQVLMATVISLVGVVLGSILGFISIAFLVAAMFKTPDVNIPSGSMWFAGCIAAAMLVGYGLRTLAKIALRFFDAFDDYAAVFSFLKKSN
jgi:hypothetical protein